MKIYFSKWISYHKCPQCGSENTFHSHALNNFDQSKNYANCWVNITSSHFNKDDITITKRDLCLDCGRDWIMYIEQIDAEGSEVGLGVKLNYTDEG